VFNCIGIVKKRKNSKQLFLKINTELPKFLSSLTKSINFNLIHLSTDCVFSGKKGNYSEKDNPDPIDFYGKSKLLGEVVSNKSLTIRTSIIGHEIQSSLGLLGWFLKKKNIHGFTRCFFSGFPTIIISEIIYKYFLQKNKLPIEGLVHIASQKISKFDLLSKIKKIYKLNITIKKKSNFFIDRSLNSNMFNKKFKFKAKPWNYMIKRMYEFY
jgi:dTDP-4-dehydrorhamnose reductase